MAKVYNGVFGGLSGTVGNIVGASWRNIWYIRLIPKSIINPKTKDQRNQRNKFIDIIDFFSPCVPILPYCWKKGTRKMSEFNAAVSYNIKNAFDENNELILSNIRISQGPVTPPVGVTISDASDEKKRAIEFNWADNTNEGWGKADDMPAFVCVDYDHGLYWWAMAGGVGRRRPPHQINIPALYPSNVQSKKKQPTVDFPKQVVHCFMVFVSQDKEVSNSIYCGAIKFKEQKPI